MEVLPLDLTCPSSIISFAAAITRRSAAWYASQQRSNAATAQEVNPQQVHGLQAGGHSSRGEGTQGQEDGGRNEQGCSLLQLQGYIAQLEALLEGSKQVGPHVGCAVHATVTGRASESGHTSPSATCCSASTASTDSQLGVPAGSCDGSWASGGPLPPICLLVNNAGCFSPDLRMTPGDLEW